MLDVAWSDTGEDYKPVDYFNPVDGDEVPVPHYGAVLGLEPATSGLRCLASRLPRPSLTESHSPSAGLQCPTYELWHEIVERVKAAGIPFIIEPTLRFKGMPGEQWTCFFKDPSGNNLEFKSMAKPELLFAKYNVAEG